MGFEALAAVLPEIIGGGAAAAAPEAAAAGAADFGLAGLSDAGLIAATQAAPEAAAALAAPTAAVTVPALAAGGAGAADAGILGGIGAGLGGLASGIGNALVPSAAAAEGGGMIAPGESIIGGGPTSTTGTAPVTPTTPSPPTALGATAPVGGSGAGSASAFGGPDLTPGAGLDLTGGIGPGGAAPGPIDLGAIAGGAGGATPPVGATIPQAAGGIANYFKNNPGLLAALGIGAAGTLAGPKLSGAINKVPQEGALKGLASQEASLQAQQQQLGGELTQPLITGNLPPEAAQSVTNAVNDAISTTKARYANLGLSGSTMEADAIANIQNQKSALTFQIAQQMATTGQAALTGAANALGLQDQVYSQLMQAQVQQDQALQQAIASFAGAAASGAGIGAGISAAKGA